STPSCSILDEWFDVAAPAEHEGIGDIDQRRKIDIGSAAGDQFDKAPVDGAILRLLLVNQNAIVMHQTAAAGREHEPPRVRLNTDIPGLRTGLTPVEFDTD